MSRRICTGGAPSHPLAGFLSAALLLAASGVAGAQTAPVVENVATADGATLTLRLAPPDENGRLRAALDIDLEPGWKTYWIAPGPVGLPPRLDASGSRDLDLASIRFPVPVRFAEGGETSVGYVAPAAVALEADATGPAPELRLDILLGLCREICIPFAATLRAAPDPGLTTRAAVASAFRALPREATADERIEAALPRDRSELRVTAWAPGAGPGADLFLEPSAGWTLGTPVPEAAPSGRATFRVPVLRVAPGAGPLSLNALLTFGEDALMSREVGVVER